MMELDTLEEVVLSRVLREMRSSIKDADLTKDYKVYSFKGFAIDYFSEPTEALDVLIAIRRDEQMLSKIAASTISAID